MTFLHTIDDSALTSTSSTTENNNDNNEVSKLKKDTKHHSDEYVVMDFVITKFNHEQCKTRQGTLITHDLVCRVDTSEYIDDGQGNVVIEEDRRKLIETYTLQPDFSQTDMWDVNGRFLKKFHGRSIFEMNIRTPKPSQTFTWLFPSEKTIEISLHLNMIANDQTTCPGK